MSSLADVCEATGREFEREQLVKRAAVILELYAEQSKEGAAPAARTLQPDHQHSAPIKTNLRP